MSRLRAGPSAALLAPLLALACAERPVLTDPNLAGLRQLADGVDGDRLMGRVLELSSAHLAEPPRDCTGLPSTASPAYCHLTRAAAAAQFRSELEDLSYQVETFDTADGDLSTSILIAEKRGATRPDEVVLVGAHYDAFYQGADDNSSGVSAVLELARLFAGLTFDRTVRFVAFDLEELGMVGSTRYAQGLPPNESLTTALVFDCIAYADSTPGSQSSIPGFPSLPAGDFLAAIANQTSLPRAHEMRALADALGLVSVLALEAPADGAVPPMGNLLRSDHAPFWLTGRTAVLATDTANFRNPNYHKDTDTPDRINPAFFRAVTQLSAATVAYWAGGPR